ncbi:MAG: hypothetical protein J6M30_04430 [Bacteroidales bacterium]|nr:hypothetical protein [Bacteroidales bacterium]
MSKLKQSLFFAALLLLVIGVAHGQISYTGAVSAQKLNYFNNINTTFSSKTICADDVGIVITLAHDSSNQNSFFMLTLEGTNTIQVAEVQNFLITDFDIFQGLIIFCGKQSSTDTNFIGFIDYASLFAGSATINTLKLPIDFYGLNLTKIRAYPTVDGFKIAAITNRCSFLDIDWVNQTVDIFFNDYHFNDLIVTEDYVSVLGTVSNSQCMVYIHNKNNMQNYTGQIFGTQERYLFSKYLIEEMPGNGIYENFVNGNQAIIGVVNDDLTDEFAIIDLNTLNIIDDFIVDSGLLRHTINDLCHDNDNQMIHCLSRDTIFKDYIYQPYPYMDTLTAVFPLYNWQLYYNLRTITPHNEYFIASGHGIGNANNNAVYWFDKQVLNSSSSCVTTKPLTEKIGSSFHPIGSYFYSNILFYPLEQSSVQSIVLPDDFYSYDCKD